MPTDLRGHLYFQIFMYDVLPELEPFFLLKFLTVSLLFKTSVLNAQI